MLEQMKFVFLWKKDKLHMFVPPCNIGGLYINYNDSIKSWKFQIHHTFKYLELF